jgi:hypothetical protein
MTYTVTTTSGSASFSVTDLAINQDTSLSLVGKGYVGYGQSINTNFVRLLENFASNNKNLIPGTPLPGQLWYDTSINQLKVYDGIDFAKVTPPLDRITSSTIGNLAIATSTITGEITNGNIQISANGTGITNINRLAILGTTVNRVLFTAANGMVITNAMQYTPTSDTLTATNINATNLAGTLTTAAQTAITSVGTLTGLTVSGTVNATTINGPVGAVTPNTGVFTSVTTTSGGQIKGYINGPIGANTANSAAFTTVTTTDNVGIGTASPLSKLDVRSGYITAGTGVSTNGSKILGGYYTSGHLSTWGSEYSNGSPMMGYGVWPSTSAASSFVSSTTINVARGAYMIVGDNHRWYSGGAQTVAIDSAVSASEVMRIDSSGNMGIGTTSPSTYGKLAVAGSVVPTATTTYDLGSSSYKWNNVYGKATSAVYADLAEVYAADRDYEPGTVVEFGGTSEITEATAGSKRVAGVISTNPGYLMNSEASGDFMLPVALQGRVPCKVRGPVRKGDMMISAGDGYAIANDDPKLGQVIGKALEDIEGDGIIEVVVGRC